MKIFVYQKLAYLGKSILNITSENGLTKMTSTPKGFEIICDSLQLINYNCNEFHRLVKSTMEKEGTRVVGMVKGEVFVLPEIMKIENTPTLFHLVSEIVNFNKSFGVDVSEETAFQLMRYIKVPEKSRWRVMSLEEIKDFGLEENLIFKSRNNILVYENYTGRFLKKIDERWMFENIHRVRDNESFISAHLSNRDLKNIKSLLVREEEHVVEPRHFNGGYSMKQIMEAAMESWAN